MTREEKEGLKRKYFCYLDGLSIGTLRSVGREIGVQKSTEKKKGDLIEDIIAIQVGDALPAEKSRRGAPVKDSFVHPEIIEKLSSIKSDFIAVKEDFERRSAEAEKMWGQKIYVASPLAPKLSVNGIPFDEVPTKGFLWFDGDCSYLYPLDGNASKRLIFAPEVCPCTVYQGDEIVCRTYTDDNGKHIYEALMVNGADASSVGDRVLFDDAEAAYPEKKLSLGLPFDLISPVGRGERVLFYGAPSTGKSESCRCALAQTMGIDVSLFVLSVGQSPEKNSAIRRAFPHAQIVASEFSSDADEIVFTAEFLLARAKRYAETGKDVCLYVDSLDALFRIFNETERSVGGKTYPCGLESKTVQFIRKFFGAGRKIEKGGSLTIVGEFTLDVDEASQIVFRELCAMATVKFPFADSSTVIEPKIEFSPRNLFLTEAEIKQRGELLEKLTSGETTLHALLHGGRKK